MGNNEFERQIQEKCKKDAERKRRQRSKYSEEKKEEMKGKDREQKHKKRQEYSEEKKGEIKEKDKKQHQVARAMHELKINYDETFDVERNDITFDSNNTTHIDDIASTIRIQESVDRFYNHFGRTLLEAHEAHYTEGQSVHRSLVCVVCDCFIIGRDEYHWISKECLLFHRDILSHNYFYKNGINPILRSQYYVGDSMLSELLLSPRARKKHDGSFYMCCTLCHDDLHDMKSRKKPPKFSISNGFAIGFLPDNLSQDITPLVNNFVAPIRAFNYFLSFYGGREKKITGNFTFFAQDVAHNMGALQHTCLTSNNPCVFIVLLGSFTQGQLDKIKTQGSYDVELFKRIYNFLHNNNDNYCLLPSMDDIPLPQVEQLAIDQDESIIEESANPSLENHICWRYWFSSTDDPDNIWNISKAE
jgi:hypothetical protein